MAEADHLGGFTLYVKGGKLTHTYSMMGVEIFKQVAEEDLPVGEVTVRMEFEADEPKPATGSEVTLFVDDRPVGRGGWTTPCRSGSRATPGWTSVVTTGGSSTSATRTEKPFAFNGSVRRSSSTSSHTLRPRTRLDLHVEAQRGHAANSLAGIESRRLRWGSGRDDRCPDRRLPVVGCGDGGLPGGPGVRGDAPRRRRW